MNEAYGIAATNISVTTTIASDKCWFWGLFLETNGTNNVTATANDGASGTRKLRVTCVGADLCYGAILPKPIRMMVGLEIVVSGTGALVDVLWEPWTGYSRT